MKKNKCAYAECKDTVVGTISCGYRDIKLPYCERHKTNVSNSLVWAIIGVMELSDSELGLNMTKKTRFKITRHAAGKTTTTQTGSKKMSAKSKLDGKVAGTGTPDRNKQKKSKKRDLPD